jgi:hypothetical protein
MTSVGLKTYIVCPLMVHAEPGDVLEITKTPNKDGSGVQYSIIVHQPGFKPPHPPRIRGKNVIERVAGRGEAVLHDALLAIELLGRPALASEIADVVGWGDLPTLERRANVLCLSRLVEKGELTAERSGNTVFSRLLYGKPSNRSINT